MYLTLFSASPYQAPQTFLVALPREMECLGLLRGACQGQLLCPAALATAQLPCREYSCGFSGGVIAHLLPAALARGQRRERRVGRVFFTSLEIA